MNETKPQYNLYEKLYFHEIEAREHINARLQLPLALIVSMVTALSFLLQNFDKEIKTFAAYTFLELLFLASASLSIAIYFFIRSMFGNTYSLLPDCEATEEYKSKLQETYKDTDNGNQIAEDHLNNYIYGYFVRCSSKNAKSNDKRSSFIHKTNLFLIITALFAVFSFLVFYFGELDVHQRNKPIEVHITQPIQIKGATMTEDNKPIKDVPPPPPPPPERLIKEDTTPKSTK